MTEQEEIAMDWAWMWRYGLDWIRIDRFGIHFMLKTFRPRPEHGGIEAGFTHCWGKPPSERTGVRIPREEAKKLTREEINMRIIKEAFK